MVILFWSIADGIASFALPIYMEQSLKNLSLVGLIFGCSSVFGLITAFILGSEQKGKTFKPYFYLSAFLAIGCFLLATIAKSWQGFLIIMILWGIYYESMNFCWIDFLGRFSRKWEHANVSGVLEMFSFLGYLLAPLITGFIVLIDRVPMTTSIFFMLIALLTFLIWFGKKRVDQDPPVRKLKLGQEFKLWYKVAKKGFWVLLAMLLYTIFWCSLIWSMGPIMLINQFGPKSAYIMSCFLIPGVFLQGYTGHLADKKGKRKFLILGLILAGLFMSLFSLSNNFVYKIIMALASAVGVAFVWPAADGLFADLVDRYKEEEEEVAGIRGVAHNLGYIIGPILAGLLGSLLGLPATFFLYGIFLVFSAVIMKFIWK
ncbi:hypothetical protein A3J78_02475 [Candidatus Beckwithbacteria bacterium RBG_13_35_6]|uniref:Major facilitator superfamily (MFS) profile domain-containing protein n=1 Tax=Candidatus Beckwithbacteria bacterium RBG_13_35_6 TaxID=1797456 RepID=A0A1F5DGF4_9BACT|nr:MAG: hypothetical protein A3J78_02475 [Candidatus Beckwithbacteria bacterium RBG_13_35_6]